MEQFEQFDLTDAECDNQELSEEDLAEVSGGSFFHTLKKIGSGLKIVGKGAGRMMGGGDVFVTPGFGNVKT